MMQMNSRSRPDRAPRLVDQTSPRTKHIALFRRGGSHPRLKHRTILRRQLDFRSFGETIPMFNDELAFGETGY